MGGHWQGSDSGTHPTLWPVIEEHVRCLGDGEVVPMQCPGIKYLLLGAIDIFIPLSEMTLYITSMNLNLLLLFCDIIWFHFANTSFYTFLKACCAGFQWNLFFFF